MHATLCDQLVDLVQNSIEAGATRIVLSMRVPVPDRLEIEVADNGRGMDGATVRRALDPFYTDGRKHRHRRVGLGLPFLKQMVEATGGALEIDSAPGAGTRVRFRMDPRHVDVPPVGDWSSTVVSLMAFGGDYELEVERRVGPDDGYRVRRSELTEALGEMETAVSLAMARDYVASLEEALTMRKGNDNGTIDTRDA